MALFQELNEGGITIGFVTHEPEIAAFTKRNIVFRDGRIIIDVNTTKRIYASQALLELHDEDYQLEQAVAV
jgi:putative ABC transport system ATP-binding protein